MKIVLRIFLLSCAIAECVLACNTPVFQYALMRWQPEPYRVLILYKKSLSEQSNQAIKFLNELEDDSVIICKYIDVLKIRKDDKTITNVLNKVKRLHISFPLLVVRYPSSTENETGIYLGKLSVSTIRKIAYSPIRKKIAKKLLRGDTIVWLVLLSNNNNRNKQIRTLLDKELVKYTSQYFEKHADKIKFCVIELKQSDQTENFLINILTNIKYGDKQDFTEPVVYPIFGKARILFPIPANKLTGQAIFAACDFMTGPCACEIKEMNPGLDLLIDIDWNNAVSSSDKFIEQVLPSSDDFSVKPKQEDVSKFDYKAESISGTENSGNSGKSNATIYLAIGIIVIGFTAISFILYRLRK